MTAPAESIKPQIVRIDYPKGAPSGACPKCSARLLPDRETNFETLECVACESRFVEAA